VFCQSNELDFAEAGEAGARKRSNMKTAKSIALRTCLMLVSLMGLGGCAALHPIPSIPAQCLPPDLLAISRNHEATIDLSLLAQTPPPHHLVDGGDVLGIYIEGVLGNPGESPPITVPLTPDLPPAIGYPITVRDDGTLSLPMIGAIPVRGLTVQQVEDKLRHIYTVDKEIIRVGQDRIIVSLQRPRQYRVLVLRQETGGPGGNEFAQGLSLNLGQTKRGSGQTIDLPVYRNDVLHALARTGGLPGLDAENIIYIVRRQPQSRPGQYAPQPQYYMPQQQQMPFRQGKANSAQEPIIRSQSPDPIRQVASHQNAGPASRSAMPAVGFAIRNQQPSQHSARVPPQIPGAGHSFAPVSARNFHDGHPLHELRAGMEAEADEQPLIMRPAVLSEISAEEEEALRPRSRMQEQLAGLRHQQRSPAFSYGATETEIVEMPQPLRAPQLPQEPMPAPPVRTGNPASPGHFAPPMYAPSNRAPLSAQPQTPYQHHPHYDEYQIPPQSESPAIPGYNGFVPGYLQENLVPPSAFGYSQSELNDLPPELMMHLGTNDPTMNNRHIIKIPVRLKPGQQPHISPEDVILQEGDIVFIETRETEIFYTGGLLGGGQYTLPRDYDLDVLGAIAIAQGANQQQQAGRQLGGVSAINGDVTISASNVIILRQLPHGQQVSIKVDLYKAISDPAERIIIQPGDIVMLRYKPLEAVGAFIERNLLESALFGLAATQLPGSR